MTAMDGVMEALDMKRPDGNRAGQATGDGEWEECGGR